MRNRTADLNLTMVALYRLSYKGISFQIKCLKNIQESIVYVNMPVETKCSTAQSIIVFYPVICYLSGENVL